MASTYVTITGMGAPNQHSVTKINFSRNTCVFTRWSEYMYFSEKCSFYNRFSEASRSSLKATPEKQDSLRKIVQR